MIGMVVGHVLAALYLAIGIWSWKRKRGAPGYMFLLAALFVVVSWWAFLHTAS